MRRGIAVATLAAAVMLAVAPGAAAAPPARNCPPAFDLGKVTLEEFLALPKHTAAIEVGVFTEDGLATIFGYVDLNEDGLVCIQSVPASPNHSASALPYAYNIVENAAVGPASGPARRCERPSVRSAFYFGYEDGSLGT